jgi:methylated-DNA-[protein]-cysteine S-methyltransferase
MKKMMKNKATLKIKSRDSFSERVWQVVREIPKGRVLTYKEVARLAGNERACRAVGNILNKNYDKSIPCHRVIRSDGRTGGYNRGAEKKITILKREKAKCFS